LVQLGISESPEDLFHGDYAYFSSFSESWLEHARDYVEMMVARFGLDASAQVVELASNDGYLLQYFQEKGIPVLGVEPAANVAGAAREKGIPTLERFFGVETAKALAADGKQADLLLGNNVLAHVPDTNDFVKGMKNLLKPDGIVTMEFPHLLQLMERNQFDTIYHEHFFYLSFLSVRKIFAHHGLEIFDVEELWTHGGSLRIFARHAEPKCGTVELRVNDLLERERKAGMDSLEMYQAFQDQVHRAKWDLLSFCIEAKEQGKRIVGYGAPAKGNTLLNYCGIGGDFLDYTVDRSPQKQGRYLPGSHIPIFAPDKIRETRPDYLLILPWNIRDEIMEQMREVRTWGGKFVVPIPKVEVMA
jgi:SAM-dependent methyltransferase